MKQKTPLAYAIKHKLVHKAIDLEAVRKADLMILDIESVEGVNHKHLRGHCEKCERALNDG